MIKYLLPLLLAATTIVAEDNSAEKPATSQNEVAVIKTSEGDMVVQFWTDAAPKTIENFKKLAKQVSTTGQFSIESEKDS